MNIEHSGQSHWIPLSDLMTGMMMVFLLISAAFMMRVEQTTTIVVQEYVQTKKDLQDALKDEFASDLKKWNAEFLGDMTIRFNDPTLLFQTGSDQLSPKFKSLLNEFFPRYIALLSEGKFKNSIKEIRIEGHTSSLWTTAVTPDEAYFKNMELSQRRSFQVLSYALQIPAVSDNREWIRARLTSNGYSYSRPINNPDVKLTDPKNQRVEIRVVANADEKMDMIASAIAREQSAP